MEEALRTYTEGFVCGEGNPAGVHARFRLGAAPEELRADFHSDGRHQGYPNRVHGGILASLFDETLARAVALHGHWCFTARLEVRYRRPLPVGASVEIVARQGRERGRFVEATGEARLADGEVVAEAVGLFGRLTPGEEEAMRRAVWPDETTSVSLTAAESTAGPAAPVDEEGR